jgi:hypothetical protein
LIAVFRTIKRETGNILAFLNTHEPIKASPHLQVYQSGGYIQLLDDLSLQSSFISLVKQCIDLEKWIDSHNADARTRLHKEVIHNFSTAARDFIKEAYGRQIYVPSTEFALIGFLKQPVTEYGSDAISALVSGAPIPVIDPTNNRVQPTWYNLLKEREAYDSSGAIHYSEFIKFINNLSIEHSIVIQNAFMTFRDQISSPDQPIIWETIEFEDLIAPFEQVNGAIERIRSFFTSVPSHHHELTICPHCGGSLFIDNGRYQCIHWRCMKEINIYEISNKPFKKVRHEKTKLVTLSPYAHLYIRIPGMEERRIAYNSVFTSDLTLSLNPDFDRVDILYEYDGMPFIQADIKDYTSPFVLAEDLASYNAIRKKGDLDKIYIVVPNDTIRQSDLDGYIKIVQKLLKPELLEHLQVVSEHKWYEAVREILIARTTKGQI